MTAGTLSRRGAGTLTALLLLAGCAAYAPHESGPSQPPAFGVPFPVDHKASAVTTLTQNGADAAQKSAGAQVVSTTSLSLPSGAAGIEWAIYLFTPAAPFTLTSAQVTFANGSTDEAWIGLADYTSQHWDFNGPYTATQSLPADSAKDVSPGGNVYIVVVTAKGRHAQLDKVSLTVDSSTWVDSSPSAVSIWSTYSSLAVVDGNPAIAYYDLATQALEFLRATDVDGTTWGAPVSPGPGSSGGTSLTVVDGNPAIGYYEISSNTMEYVRATDADGTAWGTPVSPYVFGSPGSLMVVDGKPAVSFTGPNLSSTQDMKYVRSIDADGLAWGAPVVISATGDDARENSMALVDGKPAVSYFDWASSGLKYVRASDADGAAWAAPLLLAQGFVLGEMNSLAVVNGDPAVSFYDSGNHALKFIRSGDADGAAWGSPLTLDNAGTTGWYTSLAVVGGNPAISYYDYDNQNLRYIRASDAAGSAWGSPQTLDSAGDVGSYTSLAVVDGSPAIAYRDGTNSLLKYIRLN